MNKLWKYYENIDEKKISNIQEKFNVSKLLAKVIVNRNIEEADLNIFLNPTRYDFKNPFIMPDMEKAVERIIKAIKNKEKVIIYGDYDVDGITSITVLKSFLKDRNLDVDYYIPNRLSEGYGLNEDAIKKISHNNYSLMITVDCGITSINEVELAKKFGIDTIITDHHEPGEEIPNAIAVIDCKRKDNLYSFRELAGVGVTFKLIQAISIKLNLDEKEYLKYLDIVAIGTISDIVPLIDENRTITKLGLKLINVTKNIGLQAIIKEIGYNKIDSIAVSFGIAPRINACGRMGKAEIALDLFLTIDVEMAKKLANLMNEFNYQRQIEEKKIFENTQEQIKNNNMENDDIIILKGKNWHKRSYRNCFIKDYRMLF